MHPHLPAGLTRRRKPRTPLVVAGVLAVAVAGAAATPALAPVDPHPATSFPSTGTTTDQVALVSSSARIELRRHRGSIVGDGGTLYVANRTTFRPRRMEVHLPPRVRARSWAVVDLETGRLLGKHRARAWLPQASTMKLLTAVTAAKIVDRQTPHKVSRFEARQICSCAGLVRGYRYDFRTLMAGMLLPSGNDAAEALAGSHPDGREAFYRAMNRTARRLGAADTRARNASGLTAYGSHSSARDLVLLLRAAIRRPAIASVLRLRSARIASVEGHHAHTVWRETDYPNMYPRSLGKSGYTTPAKNTLVVATWIGGHHIGVATMGAPGGYSTSGTRALTTWASNNFAGLRAVGRLPYS